MTEDLLSLITAGVDGELSAAETQRLRRVLAASPEARALFERLRSDAERLKKQPVVAPPADLRSRVMARIAALTPTPHAVPARRDDPTPHRSRPWIPVAVAASLLVGVAGSTFWFFTRESGDIAQPRNPNRPPLAAGDPRWDNWLPKDVAAAPMPDERRNPIDQNAKAPQPPVHDVVAVAPEPRTVERDLVGAHPRPDFPSFDHVQVRVPFLEPLADFDREIVRQQLTDELGRDPAFRIDVFTRNMVRGYELLQSAAKGTGLSIHADAATLNYLRKGQLSAVVLYTDSLSAAELTALFARLSAEDAKVSPRVYDMVHATPVSRTDELEIRNVLGTDPGLFKRAIPGPARMKEIERGKSISSGTAGAIVKALTTGQTGEGSAVLLAWSPTQGRTPPQMSSELKTFLAKRGERKPSAVPVLIVIRHGNG